MNILALADKRPNINLTDFLNQHQIDLIVTLGDFTFEDIVALRDITHIPKIGIYGNHCSGTYMPLLGIENMHLKTAEYFGWRFGGFQGCVRYKENPDAIMYTQQEATQLLTQFPPVDIFLSHCPPYGINDDPNELAHQGFTALRAYLDATPPKLWLHGHTYPSTETLITNYNATRIEYVSGYKLITF